MSGLFKSDLSDEDLLQLARLANQAERYSDCIRFLSAFIQRSSRDLSSEELNLLIEAHMNEVGGRRTALRSLRSTPQPEHAQSLASLRHLIETQMLQLCSELLELFDLLLGRVTSVENRVFYLKLKGCYAGYICDTALEVRNEYVEKALTAYTDALSVARFELSPAHCCRLQVALYLSTFYYDTLQDTEKACLLAQHTLDEAAQDPTHLSADSASILQLIRDCLVLWTQ